MNLFLQTQSDIIAWLDEYKIKHYELKSDSTYGFVVDVKFDVDLRSKNLSRIPIKFGHVGWSFICHNNNLTSLEGSPDTVGIDFSCCNNQITSLKGAPRKVNGDFNVNQNDLTSLEHTPVSIAANFYCQYNQLQNLRFFPQYVGGWFHFQGNQALNNAQNHKDFDSLYQIHLKDNISQEKNMIGQILQSGAQVMTPTYKI